MLVKSAHASQRLCRYQPFTSKPAATSFPRVRSTTEDATTSTEGTTSTSKPDADLDKQIKKFTRSTASTFAPRSSTAQKNPAVKGSVLYSVFEYQAWIAMVAGALLSYNIIFPTDGPSIPRLLG